jgi:dynein heavy chain
LLAADWKAIYDSPDPHKESLPIPWHGQLDAFQRIMVLRTVRPDKARAVTQG